MGGTGYVCVHVIVLTGIVLAACCKKGCSYIMINLLLVIVLFLTALSFLISLHGYGNERGTYTTHASHAGRGAE